MATKPTDEKTDLRTSDAPPQMSPGERVRGAFEDGRVTAAKLRDFIELTKKRHDGRNLTEAETFRLMQIVQDADNWYRGKFRRYEHLSVTERANESHRRASNAASNVGAIPPPRHPSWKERFRYDLVGFVCVYCRSLTGFRLLKWRPSARAVEYLKALQSAILGDGRVHVRYPRGIGKTSLGKCALLWAALYGHRRYIFCGAANSDNAASIVNDLWDMIELNPRIAADFPEANLPIAKLERRFQRCRSQHINGVPTNIAHGADGFTLPSCRDADGNPYPCSGVIFVSRGYKAGVRGLVRGSQRPDFVFIDDPQKQEGAASETECDKIESWITGDVLGLGGHDCTVSAVMTTTPIFDGDVSCRFADRSLHPEWKTITVPFVVKWPEEAEALWGQYLEIRAADEFNPDIENFENASAFYLAHREEMDAGSQVIDPNAYSRKNEFSAIQHAYNLKFTMKDSFEPEMQLNPSKANTVYDLHPQVIIRKTIKGLSPYVPPEGFERAFACAATDINRATAGLTTVMRVFDQQLTSHVLWYGIFRTKITNDIPRSRRDELTYKALVEHARQITAAAKMIPGGLDAWGVDASGEAYPTVMRIARNYLDLNIIKPTPMTGQSGQNWSPWRRQGVVGGVRNETMELVDSHGNHRIAFHADYHREIAQTSWLGEIGSPSHSTVFDPSPGTHAEYARQICAEKLVAKDIKKGVPFWIWRQTKGVPHDYGDGDTMCFALAARAGLDGSGEQKKPGTKHKRRIYNG